MEKSLIIYPISTGNELNVFSAENIQCIRIMDLHGNIVMGASDIDNTHNVINIKELPLATYIVEVVFNNCQSTRSVFVKT